MLQVHHLSFEFIFQNIHKSEFIGQRLQTQKQLLGPEATLGYLRCQYKPETVETAKYPTSKNLEKNFTMELGVLFKQFHDKMS